VVDALEAMNLKYPKVTGEKRAALAAAKVKLENE
jgi:hypothetical protein